MYRSPSPSAQVKSASSKGPDVVGARVKRIAGLIHHGTGTILLQQGWQTYSHDDSFLLHKEKKNLLSTKHRFP